MELFAQPLFLIPGSNFRGVVKVYGETQQGPGHRLRIEFSLDTIEEWIENYDVYASCTCSWADIDPEDCACGLIAIELRVRQDVHNTFTHLDDMFPKDSLVEVQVVAGRLRPTFETLNRHLSYDCNCDNFRAKINFASEADSLTSPFFDTDSEDTDELSSEFVDH